MTGRAVRVRRSSAAIALVAALAGIAIGSTPSSLAALTSAAASTGSFTTDTLSPPTGLGAAGGVASIALSWTATAKTWAAGYHVYQATASGGPYSQIATVTPRTTVGYTDTPADGTYWYKVRAYYQGWESVDAGPVSAARDSTAPTIATSVISKTSQYLPGSIKPSASFYVYANVTDPAAGSSGVATVTADVSSIKAGSTAVTLTAGAYSVGGVGYGWRSAALTADAKPAGTYGYSIRATDANGNIATKSTFSVVVDATVPSASNIQTVNGGTAGRPDAGDTVVYTFSEQIDPESVLAGWTGASTPVTVRIANSASNDPLTVWNAGNTAQLPLGSVATAGNYVTAATVFTGSMVQSGTTVTVDPDRPDERHGPHQRRGRGDGLDAERDGDRRGGQRLLHDRADRDRRERHRLLRGRQRRTAAVHSPLCPTPRGAHGPPPTFSSSASRPRGAPTSSPSRARRRWTSSTPSAGPTGSATSRPATNRARRSWPTSTAG